VAAPGRKRARAATMQQQQGARDLSREALARAAAPIDASSLFAEVMAPQAGFGDFSQPAAAAAAPRGSRSRCGLLGLQHRHGEAARYH
jgi:hypothetical protein